MLVFSSQTGIGLSGIVYAFFGLVLFNQRNEIFPSYVDKKTIQLLLGWLFLCILISELNIINIGNAAHFSGFLFGYLVAWVLQTKHITRLAIYFGVLIIAGVPIFYAPWSAEWLGTKGLEYHDAKDFVNAKSYYLKSLEKDSLHETSQINLDIILNYEYYIQADSLIAVKEYDKAMVLCNKMLALDSTNPSAIEMKDYIKTRALNTRAYELHKAKKYKEARKAYQTILLNDPTNEWAKDNLNRIPRGY